jgi:peptidoglycan/xylan/chitin deacetylase (PgdA/CDA1 family)
MRHAATGAPFDERGGRLRGVIDFAAGRYPGFLLGLRPGRILPVFHFHETTAAAFEPVCRYLVENGYRTVVSDDVARFVREGVYPGDRSVMLAFDDAWASLWLVVEPLLRRYELRAVAYAIPGRLADADKVRPTTDTGAVDAADADRAAQPFVTWAELRALAASGRVDVQSHTWSHSMVFTSDRVVGAVGPAFAAEPRLNHPRIDAAGPPEFLEADRAGYPLFPRRSRMSEGRRFFPDPDACSRAEARASGSKGSDGLVARVAGRWESEADQEGEILRELSDARDLLQSRLRTPVRHVCLPWGVSGPRTRRALERLGFVSAFANRWSGRFAVAAGDDPFFLKRLNGRHIFALPGRGRRTLVMRGEGRLR